MKNDLKLVKLDVKYCDFLRKFDSKVPFNYMEKETRPFIGVLFSVNDCKYFAPLSSPKSKHKKMKNTIDFLRLDNGNLGAINFNNMLPVFDNNVLLIDLDNEPLKLVDQKYIKLLKNQLFWLNRNDEKIYERSKKLYQDYINNKLRENIYERCCNFSLLEEKCKEYNK